MFLHILRYSELGYSLFATLSAVSQIWLFIMLHSGGVKAQIFRLVLNDM